jgi:2-beta-glucuronyltransferase
LNELTGKLLVREYQRSSLGALEAELSRADLVVFESTSAILLAPLVKQIATSARLVYRVSDDLAILRVHPAVVDAEREVLPLFDYVSAPNRYSVERVGRVREAAFDPHAIAKHLFDRETARPYHSEFNAVWVGSASLDATFLTHAAERLPHLAFHLIGRGRRAVSRPNIAWHGELPYESTVPFLQHADVGLAAYGGVGGRIPSYWADSTKIVQYAYCGLPIVAPSALRSEREHVFYYEPDDPESIEAAVKTALAAGRRSEVGRTIPSWHELARTLAGQTGNPSRTTNQRRASRDALESA